ncbi:MAG: NADH-quinone oxidoreductase, chain [Pseudomonadota bacterium]
MNEILVDFAQINFPSIIPALIIIVGAITILVVDLIKTPSKSFNTYIAIFAVCASLCSLLTLKTGEIGFFELLQVDGLSIYAQILILIASVMFLLLSLTTHRSNEFEHSEFYALFLFVIVGFQFMVSTSNLIMVFLGLETSSLALYTMIAMRGRDRAIEGAIKYFTMGALGSGFFAFGAACFYGATGSVDFINAFNNLDASNYNNIIMLVLSMAFFVAAFGFKLALVPFHAWTPDVYEGASAPLAGYMAIVPKLAAFIVAMRLFEYLGSAKVDWITVTLWIAAVLTMTLGNAMALSQESVKRMLAYSAISHSGFAIVAILLATPDANAAFLIYWTFYLFSGMGAFAMLWVFRHRSKPFQGRFDHPYEKFSGMVHIMPIGATMMCLFILSLAGVPPFGVFWGKLFLVMAALEKGYIWLAIIMVLNSSVAVYYYLKLIGYMYLHEPSETIKVTYVHNITTTFKIAIFVAATVTALAAFLVNPILSVITGYLQSAGF